MLHCEPIDLFPGSLLSRRNGVDIWLQFLSSFVGVSLTEYNGTFPNKHAEDCTVSLSRRDVFVIVTESWGDISQYLIIPNNNQPEMAQWKLSFYLQDISELAAAAPRSFTEVSFSSTSSIAFMNI